MSYQQGLKKAGLPLIRSFMQSTESVFPGLPAVGQKRCQINFKHKTYKDGKILKLDMVQTVTDAFPLRQFTKK